MATAQDIINGSARLAGILAVGQTLESGVNADALTRLNRMITRWKNSGVDLGLPTLLAANTVIVDDADEETIEIQLALRLMVRYNRPIPSGLSQAGSDAFTELQAKYAVIEEMSLDIALTRRNTFNIRTGD